MDLIFSRNVLMYFAPDSAKRVTGGFFNSLVDGGLLLISPAEGITVRSSQFIPVNFPGVTLYRKCHGRPPEPYRHSEYGAGHTEQIYCHPEDSVSSDNTQQEMQDGAHMPQREAGDNERVSPALLARTCANEGRFEEALKWCEKALSLDALNPANHYLCAAVLLEQGRIDEAIKSLKRALYLDHNFILAYFTLGNIMLNQGRAGASGKYFKNAVELLTTYNPDDVLPESDGMTAGRLLEIITVINSQ